MSYLHYKDTNFISNYQIKLDLFLNLFIDFFLWFKEKKGVA